MSAFGYHIRQCERAECALRYPIVDGHPFGLSCPRCGSKTSVVVAKELSPETENSAALSPTPVVEAMLDNVRSAWNVGSMFRSADGLGIRHLYLCGVTPTPESAKVAKTSLGAEKTITWSQHNNGVYAAIELKKRGLRLWALERDDRSVTIHNALEDRDGGPIVLVVGNEVCGVDPGILDLCERTLHIPMMGIKRSFNVAVAFGIALHLILYG